MTVADSVVEPAPSPPAPPRWREAAVVAWHALSSFGRHEAGILSGYIAFAGLLAMFPFLIFATALAAATIGPAELDALIDLLFELAPPEVAGELEPVLRRVLAERRDGVLTVAALGALWAASNGVEAFRAAFDRAYESPKLRNVVLRRVLGLVLVVVGAVVAAVLGFAVVLAPLLIGLAETLVGVSVPFGAGLARYAVAALAMAVFLYMMHLTLPSAPAAEVRRWPGILTTMAVWTLAATAFSWYLAFAPGFSATYGALAGVIVTLLFFYLSGAVIIYGAEVNAALARRRAGRAEEVTEDA